MAELNFNGANQEAMEDFSVVPAGVYNAQITKSDIVPTSNKNGTLMKLQFKIIDGELKGRIVFGQYNVANPNETAVEISRKQIKSICDAIGKPNGVRDTNELHNIPLKIKVAIAPAQGQWAEKNEIKYYDKYSGESAPAPAQASSQGFEKPSSKPDWA